MTTKQNNKTTTDTDEEGKDDDDGEIRTVRKRFSETAITSHVDDNDEIVDSTRNRTDREWKERIARGEEGEIVLPPTPKAKTIMSGFRIISMTMRDAESGDKIWETRDWGEERYAEETRADVPKNILDLKAVTREIKFSSLEKIDKFRIEIVSLCTMHRGVEIRVRFRNARFHTRGNKQYTPQTRH